MTSIVAPSTPVNINDLEALKELVKSKTYACDNIWKINAFPKEKEEKYASSYVKDYTATIEKGFDYNKEVRNKTYNMKKTPLSDYVNAIHNNEVFKNSKFASC